MESRINYTVVGLFVVFLTICMITVFFWLSTFRHRKTYDTYLVYVKEDVTGLAVQSPVRFNGVPVGFVKAIELDPKNPQLVRLTLRIEDKTPITTATVATMLFQGITGVLYVGLKANRMDAPPLEAKPGQKYPVIPWKPSFIVQISQVLPEIAKNVEKVGTSVDKLLDSENLKSIKNTLKNVQTFTKTLAENNKELDRSMKSLNKALNNTADASEEFPALTKQMQTTLKSLQRASNQFTTTARTAGHTFSASSGVISNFSDQLLPVTQQAMSQLNQVMSNLKHITNEMIRNPSILIRGQQPARPGPGER